MPENRFDTNPQSQKPTFLLTWSVDHKDAWPDRHAQVESVRKQIETLEDWSSSNRSVKTGDRVLILRQGGAKGERGFFGSGWANSEWTAYSEDSKSGYIWIKFEHLLSPDEPEQILRLVDLDAEVGELSTWRARGSGVLIDPAVARNLEPLWALHVRRVTREHGDGKDQIIALHNTHEDEELSAFEGQARRRFHIHRTREGRLRQAKIDAALRKGELRCEVPGCNFSFEEVYGKLGERFAHVHHLKPLSDQTDPTLTTLNDLAIVCCNCHSMIHRHGQCRSVESLVIESAAVKQNKL